MRHVRKGVPRAGHSACAPPATCARGAPRRPEPQSRRGGLLHSLRQAVRAGLLIRRIQQKLAGHSHFQNEAAQRLLMCEDCRVKDVFAALAADPVSQLKV